MKIYSLTLILSSLSPLLTPIVYANTIDGDQIVTILGTDSPWNPDNLIVGDIGNGTLLIQNGGIVEAAHDSYIAKGGSSVGVVEVSGTDSRWNNNKDVIVADWGQGTLTISGGGVVNNRNGMIGYEYGSTGFVTVSGTGSQWNNNGELYVGNEGQGTLTISDGGLVTSVDGFVVTDLGLRSEAAVSGVGSHWNNSGDLYIGYLGDSILTIADQAMVSARTMLLSNGSGSGTLNIGNGNLAGSLNTTSIIGGEGTATVNFNHVGNINFSPLMSGSLNVNQINQGVTTLMSVNDYVGVTTVSIGTLQSGISGAFSYQSDFVNESGAELDLAGYNQTIASLNNSGVVHFNGAPGTVLTVTSDYIGNNGLLRFNTHLGDDSSLSDKLVVEGNTIGTTWVQVNNAGGSGAQTLNGIEVVQVKGQSDGVFTQAGRIVAGAYDYFLGRGAGAQANNWVLSSSLSPDPVDPVNPDDPVVPIERPETSGYIANLVAANTLFATRLHDRLGETRYTDALTGEQKVTSLWLRNEGGHNRFRDSLDQLGTQSNRYVMQLGGDIAQWTTDQNRFHLGVMGGYGNSKSKTDSRVTGYRTDASMDGYSLGMYGTWQANEADKTGLYVDGWAQYSWFDNSVSGQGLASEHYQSKGVTASVESGYTVKVGENTAKTATYFIQPQAQVTWMGVKADDHKEANGTNVSGKGDGNIQTRLGGKAFMTGSSAQDKGKDRVFQPFVEANWVHNTEDFGTQMDGMTVTQAGAGNIAELKAGVEGQLNKRVNMWGNVSQQVGSKGYSDTAVMLGVKVNF
ncbi:autotransporter outer membrane beta-barrel domain-containing protein [Yersinia enterocolitica]|uniref:autotransporter outer membrane beta-barrel domain-containing protein n=1 Tax=Yersinia enterocolitica TaxID=630 RepID=UPI00398D3D85